MTPTGWRYSVLTVEDGVICGGSPGGVPADVDPRDARAAAALCVRELARDLHGAEVDVVWEPSEDGTSWSARVRVVGDGSGG
ncbi:hypothetical protein ACWFR1_24060 [Streptomyces sp. NPDC055103]